MVFFLSGETVALDFLTHLALADGACGEKSVDAHRAREAWLDGACQNKIWGALSLWRDDESRRILLGPDYAEDPDDHVGDLHARLFNSAVRIASDSVLCEGDFTRLSESLVALATDPILSVKPGWDPLLDFITVEYRGRIVDAEPPFHDRRSWAAWLEGRILAKASARHPDPQPRGIRSP